MVSAVPAFSGGYYYGLEIDEYNKETGFYYKSRTIATCCIC